MINFDKKTTKILKTICQNHKGVSYKKLLKIFRISGDGWFSDFAELIYLFYKEGYISCENPREVFSTFDETDKVISVAQKAIFLATPKANALIESKTTNFVRWLVPTVISVFALIVAIISLVIQFV